MTSISTATRCLPSGRWKRLAATRNRRPGKAIAQLQEAAKTTGSLQRWQRWQNRPKPKSERGAMKKSGRTAARKRRRAHAALRPQAWRKLGAKKNLAALPQAQKKKKRLSR